MKKYRLFLDDIRFPAQADWVIARSMDDAVWYVLNWGIPTFISFDHDLALEHYQSFEKGAAGEKTGYIFAKWFADYVLMNELDLPVEFDYSVHSMNPVGAKNIRDYMEEFIRHYRLHT